MPFEQGSISCRVFYLPRPLPEDAAVRFGADAAPPLEGVSHGEVKGWVTGRHLLDRQITSETAYYGGYLRLTMLTAERKVPAALLRAECRMEELSRMAALGASVLGRRERMEIRREVEERLLPAMPPQLKGIPMVVHGDTGMVYAGATSVKQVDALGAMFLHSLGFPMIPCVPGTVSLQRAKLDVRDWRPTSFSPEMPDDRAELHAGREFLTWLWFTAEARGGMTALGEHGDVGILIEGPLTFVHEGNGAHESVLRKGEPLLSAEAKTCLLSGKKLQSAKLTLARGEEIFSTQLNADEFIFRGLRLPDNEAPDGVGRFQERMIALDRFRDMFFRLFDLFVEERKSPAVWKGTQGEIHAWVRDRPTRT